MPTYPPKLGELRLGLLELTSDLPEGTLLPSERALAARWRVARMTLRRAMDGLVAEGRLLDLRRYRSDRALALRLGIPIGDPVVEFVRLRLADGVPMAVERTWIREAAVPGLEPDQLDGSWYELLDSRYDIRVTGGSCRLEPTTPDRRSAEWLEIPPAQSCLASTVTSLDVHGHIVDIGASLFRGDRYTITADLRPGLETVR